MSSLIDYKIKYSDRKSIMISINNNGEVVVTAPKAIKENEIEAFISKKERWIKSKLEMINNRISLPKDSIMYLGEIRKVKVEVQRYLKREFVVQYNNEFIINVKDKGNVVDVLKKYMIREFDTYVRKKVQKYERYINVKPLEIKVKDVKSRWGSCTYDNKLSFNYRLIMANEKIIEYVVVHEMCHMIHKNHSKEYWSLVEEIFPIYRECDKWLKENEYLLQILHLQL